MAAAMFFQDDEVSVFSEKTGFKFGVVTESAEYFSSDDDYEEDADEPDANERITKGTVRVTWYPDGKTEVLKEAQLKLADRALMPGDVVRRLIQGQDSQRGYVTNAYISCHLRVIGKPFVICDVDSSDLLSLSKFNLVSGEVYLDSWVGKISESCEKVTVRFCDGARCEISDPEGVDMLYDFKELFDKQPKDGQMHLYEGQLLKGELGSLQGAKWINTTKSFNQNATRKSRSREVVVTVEKVEIYQVEVNWHCRGYSGPQPNIATSVIAPPPRIVKDENLERLKMLNCFVASDYQIGDRAYYVLKQSDKVIPLDAKDRRTAVHQVMFPKQSNDTTGHHNDESSSSSQNVQTLPKADSEMNDDEGDLEEADLPAANDMEPLVASASSSITDASGKDKKMKSVVRKQTSQIRQLKKRKMKPAKVKLPNINLETSLPSAGQKLVVEVIYTLTAVDIMWQDGSRELKLSSTDLLPIHHLDELEFFPGDYVISATEIQTDDVYGVVQSVDHSGRTCKVLWIRHDIRSSSSSVTNLAVSVLKEEEVSVYDIKDHPDFKFRIGYVVVRVAVEEDNVNEGDQTGSQHAAGQVYELCGDGSLVIQWEDGSRSLCNPLQLYCVGDEMLTELNDSESEHLFDSESGSSSVASWEWETEEEEQLPLDVDTDAGLINSVVESSTLHMDVCGIIRNVKDVLRKIEGLVVSSTKSHGSSLTSAKFFRQLTLLFRLCHDFDKAASTSFFSGEEIVTLASEIKKFAKKGKTQHYFKQTAMELLESGIMKISNGNKSAEDSATDRMRQDESGNDSGLEKSPSNSDLRDMETNLPVDSSTGMLLAHEIKVALQVMEGAKSCCSIDLMCPSIGVITVDETSVDEGSTIDPSASVTKEFEGSVNNMTLKPKRMFEVLNQLGRGEQISENEVMTLIIDAIQLLRQVLSSNMEKIKAAILSCSCCSKSSSIFVCDQSSSSKTCQSLPATGLNDSVNKGIKELPEAETSSGPTTETADPPGCDDDDGSKPVTSPVFSLALNGTAANLDGTDTISMTPLTPAEVKAKIEFNPDGFMLLDTLPVFHHYKDEKHTPVDARAFCSTIRKEMKLLQSCLPKGIYVKGFESRMDLFSIMIEGPSRTPYEDGLFFFDVHLPNDYPLSPPHFFYVSYCTDRLNPNLYADGKVCVSLLGTWTGKGTEMWHSKSNLLQVLVSIQGLILNREPYYNEAGYERQKGTQLGHENSRMYNEMAIVKMVQSMTKLVFNPFQVYSTEIRCHLEQRAHSMINRLKFWINTTEANSSPCSVSKMSVPSSSLGPSVQDPSSLMCSTTVQVNEFESNETTATTSYLQSICDQNGEVSCTSVVVDHNHHQPQQPHELIVKGFSDVSKLNAVSAESNAESGENNAELAETKAESAGSNAESSKSNAESGESNESVPQSCFLVEKSRSFSSSLDPRSQNSVEALCHDQGGRAFPFPEFPLFPVSKGFKLSLSKCLDNFESVLISVGICSQH